MEPQAPWHDAWADVDGTSDPEWFVRYLEFSRAEKVKSAERDPREFFSSLELVEGHSVLEVGCGTADLLIPLAKVVGNTGRVVGVDRSKAMVAAARKQLASTDLPVECSLGDACKLDFKSNSFDRSFASAVFQHLPDPRKALMELNRVTRPGGKIVVTEHDWDTQIISAKDGAVTRKILQFFCDSVCNGRIGSRLVGLFRELELTNIGFVPLTFISTDFAKTEEGLGLRLMAKRAEEAGEISQQESELWVKDLEERGRKGKFFRAVTTFRVSGYKPYPIFL